MQVHHNTVFFLAQIQKVMIALGDYQQAQCHACIGGTNVRDDMRKLEAGVHVVVGTPGRVYDMINRRALSKSLQGIKFDLFFGIYAFHFSRLIFQVCFHWCVKLKELLTPRTHCACACSFFSDPNSIKMFVLDEADEMLSRGFKDQIYDVFRNLPTSSLQVSFLFFLQSRSIIEENIVLECIFDHSYSHEKYGLF